MIVQTKERQKQPKPIDDTQNDIRLHFLFLDLLADDDSLDNT